MRDSDVSSDSKRYLWWSTHLVELLSKILQLIHLVLLQRMVRSMIVAWAYQLSSAISLLVWTCVWSRVWLADIACVDWLNRGVECRCFCVSRAGDCGPAILRRRLWASSSLSYRADKLLLAHVRSQTWVNVAWEDVVDLWLSDFSTFVGRWGMTKDRIVSTCSCRNSTFIQILVELTDI